MNALQPVPYNYIINTVVARYGVEPYNRNKFQVSQELLVQNSEAKAFYSISLNLKSMWNISRKEYLKLIPRNMIFGLVSYSHQSCG